MRSKAVARAAANGAASDHATVTDLGLIFDEIQAIMEPFGATLSEREGGVRDKRDYHLISFKEVEINGRKRKELYFASIIQQKDYVGFYFNPVYCRPDAFSGVSPSLLKLLKGKSCFHVRKLDDTLRCDISAALKAGLAACQKLGWV